jgi:hypothetical protein
MCEALARAFGTCLLDVALACLLDALSNALEAGISLLDISVSGKF